jgi:ABC-type branched-subunit amino acid transport system substrate-binding protein
VFSLKMKSLTAAAAVVLLVGACSSSSKTSSSSNLSSSATTGRTGASGSGGGRTYTIGLVADETGLAAPSFATSLQGVKAGIALAAKEGYNLKYVVVDSASSPTGVLAGAHKVVDQDHVFAVVLISAFASAASQFLTSKGVPVLGFPEASEWITQRNMFGVVGATDFTKVTTQAALILKRLGVTNIASIGYSIVPASAETAKASAIAAQLEGIKVGYLNANFPFGSTNVGPVALALKSAGVDGLIAPIEINTELALINQLRNDGVQLKGAVLETGYGGDLTGGGPGATQSAQGLYFSIGYEPFEMNTPATKQFQSYLQTAAGVTGGPTVAEYSGYMSVDALVDGLKAAGPNPTQASLINALLGITHYDGAGLFGEHSVSFVVAQRGQTSGPDNCFWVTRYSGSSFHLVAGMDPICGQTVPGKTVSASS